MAELIVTNDYQEMSFKAARIVAQGMLTEQRCVLGFPTGQSPVGLYKLLVVFYSQGLLDFSHVVIFTLDEFCGVPRTARNSYAHFIEVHLSNYVNIPFSHVNCLRGDTLDIDKECREYEKAISAVGGMDLLILGLGRNGHIGFNEPGTDWATMTHCGFLSQETRQSAAKSFGNLESTPTEGLTMGIKTIMNARKLLLLVSGKAKALALAKSLEGPITRSVPASVLQLHPNVLILADKEAVSLLNNT